MARQRKIEMHWVCSSCGQRNLGRHKECQRCGNPKDESEPWLMPDDPGKAPSVTDPELLRQASAGADWQCAYCGSHQRRLDGRCQQCGSSQSEGADVGPRPRQQAAFAAPAAAARNRRTARNPGRVLLLILLSMGAIGISFICCVFVIAPYAPPTGPVGAKAPYLTAEVTRANWTHRVQVERYRIESQEGFIEDRPGDALNIESLGERHHHDEQVLDHYRTEHYTEQVPYQETETYQADERCGEDCVDLPENCYETCTPDNNGFATCTEHCSGGGQSCTPRYCSVTRSRQVTRYRSEPRTRQVPVYRSEPRHQEFFRWEAWRWGNQRVVEATGQLADALRWPSDEELEPPAPLATGERERYEQRSFEYEIHLRDEFDGEHALQPNTAEEFNRIRDAAPWIIELEGSHFRLVRPVAESPGR